MDIPRWSVIGLVLAGMAAAEGVCYDSVQTPARSGTEPAPQAFVPGPPPLQPEPLAVDFGFLAPGESRSAEVRLRNAGNQPVTIAAIQPTCTCTTTSDLAGKVVGPGESVSFDASLSGSVVPGPRKATVKILADGFGRALEIDVRGEVALPIRAVPSALTPPPQGPARGRVVVESVDRRPFRVVASHGTTPEYLGFDPARDEPRATYVIRTDLESLPREAWPAFWVVETDHPSCPVIGLKVRDERFNLKPVLRMREFALNVGVLQPERVAHVDVDLQEPLPEGATVTLPEGWQAGVASVEPLSDGCRVRLRLQPPPQGGSFVVPVTLRSGSREQSLWMYGAVRPAGEAAADAKVTPRG
ncbi:MAG: hypothetical protein RLZZ558_313 [Planctomycetota bacterium]|jgi:hypothetical protein